MALPLPAYVSRRIAASGGLAPLALVELQALSGNRYFWSDARVAAPSVLAVYYPPASGVIPQGTNTATPMANFLPWLLKKPTFHLTRSTATATGSLTVQNLSGDTVRRDTALIFSQQEMTGALVFYRRWLADCEAATFQFQGNVDEAEIAADGDSMTLSLEGMCNWSKIDAPDMEIGVSCGLTFGSVECGSTSTTPCTNSYGTCSSIERYKGILVEWTGAQLDYTQYVQPPSPCAWSTEGSRADMGLNHAYDQQATRPLPFCLGYVFAQG